MANLSMVGVVLPLAKAIRTSLQVLLRGADQCFLRWFASQQNSQKCVPHKTVDTSVKNNWTGTRPVQHRIPKRQCFGSRQLFSPKIPDLRKGRKVSKNLRFEHLNSCTETQLEITFQRRKSHMFDISNTNLLHTCFPIILFITFSWKLVKRFPNLDEKWIFKLKENEDLRDVHPQKIMDQNLAKTRYFWYLPSIQLLNFRMGTVQNRWCPCHLCIWTDAV